MWLIIIVILVIYFYDFPQKSKQDTKNKKAKKDSQNNYSKYEIFKSKPNNKQTEEKNNFNNKKKTNSRSRIFSKIAGVTKENRQGIVKTLNKDEELKLEREKNNSYDSNAIAIYRDNKIKAKLGYIKRNLAKEIAPQIDKGIQYNCKVKKVTGKDKAIYGVNILLEKQEKRDNFNRYEEPPLEYQENPENW